MDVLLDSAAGGVNTVEREGVSRGPRGNPSGEVREVSDVEPPRS